MIEKTVQWKLFVRITFAFFIRPINSRGPEVILMSDSSKLYPAALPMTSEMIFRFRSLARRFAS